MISPEFHPGQGPKRYIPLAEDQLRQLIDSETTYRAYLDAFKASKEVRGSMFWRDLVGGRAEDGRKAVAPSKYLIRESASGAQKSLGPESDETRKMFENFTKRKREAEERLSHLKKRVELHQRLNRAQRAGRAPNIVVDLLARMEQSGIADKFLVVGTHAMFAYEAAAGVRIVEGALATQDVDFLFDTRKRLTFVGAMKRIDSSLLGLFKKVDPSFKLSPLENHTAVNNDGFEVDIIRRIAKDDDPHPLRMTDDEDDFWAVQASQGEELLGARTFEQVIASTSGTMARMRTIHPMDFVRLKEKLAASPARDPLKAPKDLLQAEIVRSLVKEYLPHLLPGVDEIAPPIGASGTPDTKVFSRTHGRTN